MRSALLHERRMASAPVALSVSAMAVAAGPAAPAPPVEVRPHRAVYSMTLATAKNSSGVVAAHGALSFEWGDSCDGWTIEQRSKLQLVFAQNAEEVEITTNYITWESKDGTSYRFKVRKTKNGNFGGRDQRLGRTRRRQGRLGRLRPAGQESDETAGGHHLPDPTHAVAVAARAGWRPHGAARRVRRCNARGARRWSAR